MGWWSRWREARFAARHPFPETDWQAVRVRLPLLAALDDDLARRLGQRAWRLLHAKRLSCPEPLDIDLPTRLGLFAQAALLTLGWSEGDARQAFSNVHEVLLLPATFRRRGQAMDEAGVMHDYQDERAGETWYQGPVVLSLTDVADSGDWTGFNVVIHEFAHKLDMGNSLDVDGFPPLPANMAPAEWHHLFTAVWEDLQEHLARGEPPPIDDYAATHPGECFAVCCEYFFTAPDVLHDAYPELYGLLERYFQQSPLARLSAVQGEEVVQISRRSAGSGSGQG